MGRNSARRIGLFFYGALIALGGGIATVPIAIVREWIAGSWGIVDLVIIAPVVEEICKQGATYFMLLKMPSIEIPMAVGGIYGALSGLSFATVENLLYIFVYIEDPTPELIRFRLVYGTLLHAGCSALMGVFVARAFDRDAKPDHLRYGILVWGAAPAIAIHGVFNLLVTLGFGPA
ncbi:MAG: PrsW family glutamic-type intramembrane protease [bacterium]